MIPLRTNTATRITVGPFIDKTDGITPEVALTVTSEKLTLVLDIAGVPTLILDVAPTASGGANDLVHITGDDAGLYDLELSAADTNYIGRGMLCLNDVATHCPVWHEVLIMPAVEYDAKILGTDLLQVDLTQVAGATTNVAALATNVDTILTDVVAIIGYLDTEIGAIKAKTDLIPASPAATGDIPSAATIATAVVDKVIP